MTYLAAFADFDGAGSTGVKFYRYTDGFLHEKVMLIDLAVRFAALTAPIQ